MKKLLVFISLSLISVVAFADHCPDLLHCRLPFPWKEWALICGTCWGGCWWFCRKCRCTGGNCDLTPVLTAIAALDAKVTALDNKVTALETTLNTKLEDIQNTVYLAEHEL